MSNQKLEFRRGSAEFKMGIEKMIQLERWLIENPNAIGIAFVGRSNVGKSTLINSLLGNKTARTSKTPGRTRQVNIFEFKLNGLEEGRENKFFLYDLPGYGHAEVSKEMAKNWTVLLDTFFTYSGNLTLLVNIQDARHPHQQVDQDFQEYIEGFTHETTLVFNKMDKLKTQSERSKLRNLQPQIFKEYKNVKGIHFISAEKKENTDALELSLINFLLQKQDALKLL